MKRIIVLLLSVFLLITLAACNEVSENQSVSQSEVNVESSQEEPAQSSEVVDSGEVPEFVKAIDAIRAQENVESFPAVAQAFMLEEEGYSFLLQNPETQEKAGFILSEEEMSELIIYTIDHATGTLVQVYFDEIASSISSYLIGTFYYYHIDDKLIMMVQDSGFYDNDTKTE